MYRLGMSGISLPVNKSLLLKNHASLLLLSLLNTCYFQNRSFEDAATYLYISLLIFLKQRSFQLFSLLTLYFITIFIFALCIYSYLCMTLSFALSANKQLISCSVATFANLFVWNNNEKNFLLFYKNYVCMYVLGHFILILLDVGNNNNGSSFK